jgi:hypothetical protein
MKADMLAGLRRIMRGDGSAVTPVTPCVTPETFGVTPVTPLRPKNNERESEKDEGVKRPAHAPVDVAEIEERAGLASDRVPPAYLDAWARLNHQKPAAVSEAQWRLALDDGGRFLDGWGSEATELRWTPGDLFDVTAGLVWRLSGERVEDIGADQVRLTGGRTFQRRDRHSLSPDQRAKP